MLQNKNTMLENHFEMMRIKERSLVSSFNVVTIRTTTKELHQGNLSLFFQPKEDTLPNQLEGKRGESPSCFGTALTTESFPMALNPCDWIPCHISKAQPTLIRFPKKTINCHSRRRCFLTSYEELARLYHSKQ